MPNLVRIELSQRPENAVMSAMFSLLTCVFGSSEKELEWQQGAKTLLVEDFPETEPSFADVLRNRSWDDPRFETGRRDSNFEMGMTVFGGQEKWSEFLKKVFETMVVSITVEPQPEQPASP
jgi:hypothetical protein